MPNACLNLTHISAFDASKDIIWSFSYKLENKGIKDLDGGFTTYLDFSVPTLSGSPKTLGFSNKDKKSNNNFIVVGFDTKGDFSTNTYYKTGLNAPVLNSMTLRLSTNFAHLTTVQLASYFPLSSPDFQSLRFQLTNLGNTFNVFYLDSDIYKKIISVETGETFVNNEKLYIGMSWSNISSTSKIYIKNLHYQAQT
jgi:hypothetical protein